LSPKRKNQLDQAQNNQIYVDYPIFSPDFKADLAYWYRTEPKKGDKILDLVADILDGEQFTGDLTRYSHNFLIKLKPLRVTG
jgi:toxin YoeB